VAQVWVGVRQLRLSKSARAPAARFSAFPGEWPASGGAMAGGGGMQRGSVPRSARAGCRRPRRVAWPPRSHPSRSRSLR